MSGPALKISIQGKSSVKDIKNLTKVNKYKDQDISLMRLLFQGKELKDNIIAQSIPLKQGDQLILMITQAKEKDTKIQVSQSHHLNVETLETGEEYKKAVENLVLLGFKREDVVITLRQCERNLKTTLVSLINKERKQFMTMELDIEEQEIKENELQLNLDSMKVQALKDSPLVQKLVDQVRGDPELWLSTLQQMQSSNKNIYDDIVQNQHVFFEILNQRINNDLQGELKIVNQDDALIIAQIQELDPSVPQEQIINQFVRNNKNTYETIKQLNSTQKS